MEPNRSRRWLPALVAAGVVVVLLATQVGTDLVGARGERNGPGVGLSRLTQEVAEGAAEAQHGSAGCASLPRLGAGSTQVVPLRVGGRERSFRLHVPSEYRPGRPTPLVVAFHGRHRSGALLEADTGLSGLPVIVAYPEGTVNQVGRLDWQIGPQAAPGVDDLAFTRGLIGHVESRWCVDRDRVYALGHSNGGGMAVTAACSMPKTFAAVVAISGAFYDRVAACVGTPVALMELHGTADRVIPYRGGVLPPAFGDDVRLPRIDRWVRNQARVNECTRRPALTRPDRDVLRARWSGCGSGRPVEHVRIAGGLHRVPTARDLGGTPLALLVWSFLGGRQL